MSCFCGSLIQRELSGVYNSKFSDEFIFEFEVFDRIYLKFGFKPEQIEEAFDYYKLS